MVPNIRSVLAVSRASQQNDEDSAGERKVLICTRAISDARLVTLFAPRSPPSSCHLIPSLLPPHPPAHPSPLVRCCCVSCQQPPCCPGCCTAPSWAPGCAAVCTASRPTGQAGNTAAPHPPHAPGPGCGPGQHGAGDSRVHRGRAGWTVQVGRTGGVEGVAGVWRTVSLIIVQTWGVRRERGGGEG